MQHLALDDLIDDVFVGDRAESVEHGLAPRRHLLVLGAGQVAEFLPAHGVQRTEDQHLGVLLPLEHRLEPGAQGQG